MNIEEERFKDINLIGNGPIRGSRLNDKAELHSPPRRTAKAERKIECTPHRKESHYESPVPRYHSWAKNFDCRT